jgi:hypothetical protein
MRSDKRNSTCGCRYSCGSAINQMCICIKGDHEQPAEESFGMHIIIKDPDDHLIINLKKAMKSVDYRLSAVASLPTNYVSSSIVS